MTNNVTNNIEQSDKKIQTENILVSCLHNITSRIKFGMLHYDT